MPRYHTTKDGNIPFTIEEESIADANDSLWDSQALARAKSAKTIELTGYAELDRNAGFTSSALGTVNTYDSTLEGRINLIGASQGGQPTNLNLKESGVRKRISHNTAQINTVLADGFAALQAINDKESGLLDQLDAATTLAELDNINW